MVLPLMDFNLLRVFDAVIEERSLPRARQKSGAEPVAASHSLARLPEVLEDDLFVRTAACSLRRAF